MMASGTLQTPLTLLHLWLPPRSSAQPPGPQAEEFTGCPECHRGLRAGGGEARRRRVQSRRTACSFPPTPAPMMGKSFWPHHEGRKDPGSLTYLAVGVTVLASMMTHAEDNSQSWAPGGGLVPRVPLPFPVRGTVPFPWSPQCWWRRQAGSSKTHSRVLFCTTGWGSPRVQWRGHTSGHHAEVITPPPPSSLQGDPMLYEPSQGDPDSNPAWEAPSSVSPAEREGTATDMPASLGNLVLEPTVLGGHQLCDVDREGKDGWTDRRQAAAQVGSPLWDPAHRAAVGLRGSLSTV